jgi:hypothetical protein
LDADDAVDVVAEIDEVGCGLFADLVDAVFVVVVVVVVVVAATVQRCNKNS